MPRPRLAFAGVIGALLLALGQSANPPHVAAECTAMDPWPSFRAAAPVARQIVVGEVVEAFATDSTDHATLFRLRVDHVYRGDVANVLDFHDAVRSGAPLTICPADSILRVRVGDVLAFAFDAQLAGYPNPVTAVALVNRGPDEVERFLMPGVKRISLRDVRDLAALPATDSAQPPAAHDAAPFPVVPLIVAVVGAVLVLSRRPIRSSRDIPRR